MIETRRRRLDLEVAVDLAIGAVDCDRQVTGLVLEVEVDLGLAARGGSHVLRGTSAGATAVLTLPEDHFGGLAGEHVLGQVLGCQLP